jgi:hypothetical protein
MKNCLLRGKNSTLLAVVCLVLLWAGICESVMADGPPPLPTIPGRLINAWRFNDTNWLSIYNDAPRGFGNIECVESWDGHSLLLDSTNPALLNYNVVEADGWTNLVFDRGTIAFWAAPRWSSANVESGTGPGSWGRFLEAGAWTSNSSYGWFSAYVDQGGTNVYFSAQTNGAGMDLLSAPISWNSNEWHWVVITYDTNSTLYLDGQWAADGPATVVRPGPDVLTNGFFIGSDSSGFSQARCQFDDLRTWDYAISAATVQRYYDAVITNVWPKPSGLLWAGGGFNSSVTSPPDPGDGTNGVAESPCTNCVAAYNWGTNDLWLEILPLGTNQFNADTNFATLLLHNGQADIDYAIQSKNSLNETNWAFEVSVLGRSETNVVPTTVSMIGRSNLFFRVLAYTLDSDGQGLPDWWQLKNFGVLGIDPFADPDGDGRVNLNEYQNGTNPNSFEAAPAPSGLIAVVNTNGTALLTWTPAPGPPTSYVIERSYRNPANYYSWIFQQVATVGGAMNFYVDTGGFSNSPPQGSFDFPLTDFGLENSTYRIHAVYAGGSSLSSEVMLQAGESGLSVEAHLVRNSSGRWQIVCGYIPERVTSLRLNWFDYNYSYDSSAFLSSTNLALSNFTAGVYVIPDSEIIHRIEVVGPFGLQREDNQILWVQGVDGSGLVGAPVMAGIVQKDAPYFVDGSEHMKQNLAFQLRAATTVQPCGITEDADWNYTRFDLPNDTNYVESGFLHNSTYWKSYNQIVSAYVQFNNLWPFVLNYQLHNRLYDTNEVPASFAWQTNSFSTNPAPAVLGLSDPFWISQSITNPPELGLTVSSPPHAVVSLASGFHNAYGLQVGTGYALSSEIDWTTFTLNPEPKFPLTPGASRTLSNSIALEGYYSQFAAPELEIAEYYFAPIATAGTRPTGFGPDPVVDQVYPLPINSGFATTNQTGLLFASVGEPSVFAGWAKEQIYNGSSDKFGYLGQYFDGAYRVSTNGTVTTNHTGVLSPYGEFLPVEPGPAALATRAHGGTGQRGTGIVHSISLNLDANHDGVMDLTFGGPDRVDSSHVFRFWVNGDNDYFNSWGASSTDPRVGEDITARGHDYESGLINSMRDLEDFARLWICGVPSLTNGDCQVTLRWANIRRGTPAIKLFQSIEADGGTHYLSDLGSAAVQAAVDNYAVPTNAPYYMHPAASIGGVTPGQPYTFSDNFFTNGANKYLLFEGSGVGEGELVLTISSGSRVLGRASTWLDLHDVRDFYERVVITNNTAGAISGWSSATQSLDPASSSALGSDPDLIVLVHGINVPVPAWLTQSDTVFKRLYWAGYHGKFATVKWPCEFFTLWAGFIQDYTVFNRSEVKGYKAGAAMKSYIDQLHRRFTDHRLHLLVHSQGNSVVSEAIELGANFDTYVLTQGAIPASSYDVNYPLDAGLSNSAAIYGPSLEWSPMGYRGVYTNITGRVVNFYNPHDPVLAVWVNDQGAAKPNLPSTPYSYDGTNGWFNKGLPVGYVVTDPHESRAYVSRARTLSVGVSGPASGHGIIGSAVDLNAQYGFNDSFPGDHSAQWVWPIQAALNYFREVLFQIQPGP